MEREIVLRKKEEEKVGNYIVNIKINSFNWLNIITLQPKIIPPHAKFFSRVWHYFFLNFY